MSNTLLEQFQLLAKYNEWMNNKIYDAAARLPASEWALERGAFFGSIMGTCNHLVVTDTIWLKRFANHPMASVSLEVIRLQSAPTALNQILFSDFAELRAHRQMLDWAILAWSTELTESDLAHELQYSNTKGVAFKRSFASLLVHFFNHQTHHRGQATTLLFQAGQDVGGTDLLELIPKLG